MARGDGKPSVDVGIPAYRRADFLAEAVESVLAQTLGDWRLTICDNSPGGGPIEDAVRPYLGDPRVTYRASGREITHAENWTAAIQGSAPYVGVLNDDDRWHPRFLEVRVEALEAHPECGFAFSGTTYVDHTGADLEPGSLLYEEGVVQREVLARRQTRVVAIGHHPCLVRIRSPHEQVRRSAGTRGCAASICAQDRSPGQYPR